MNVNLKACLTFGPHDTHEAFVLTAQTLISHSEQFTFLKRMGRRPREAHGWDQVCTQRKNCCKNLQTGEKRNRICRGHSLFSPEAVIYLGRSPTLNHCVCFYGLSGFVCAPQPLKLVWGTSDFCPNLGIVKPHCFLTLERCLASHMGRWGTVYTAHQLRGSMQMSLGCVLVWILLWRPNPELIAAWTVWRRVTSLLVHSAILCCGFTVAYYSSLISFYCLQILGFGISSSAVLINQVFSL